MKNFNRILISAIYAFQLGMGPIGAEPTYLQDDSIPGVLDVRSEGEDIVIVLSQSMPFKPPTNLPSQSKLILEIEGAAYRAGFSKKNIDTEMVRRVRGYQFKENPLISRVILDLKAPVDYKAYAAGNNIILNLKRNAVLAEEVKRKKATNEKAKTKQTVRRKRDLLNSLPKEVVTLDFEGADIRDVIRLMSETSNINIIFGPEVAGNISIHLKRVPFDEAFQTILNLKGLVATQLGVNILRVTTPDILSREQSKAVVFTKSIPINYLAANEMQTHLQAVMSSAGRKGTITVVKETNNLVVTDTQEGIAQAERLVGQLDKKPAQVMIEARIVEINLNNGFDIGVQWEYFNANVKTNGDYNFVGLNPKDGEGARIIHTGIDADGEEVEFGAASPLSNGTGVSLPGPKQAGITFGFIKDDSIFNATLNALVTQSKAKILSAPKVVTINGQEAKIEAVQEIPFRTSTVSGTGVVSNSFTNVPAGIILTVKPTINAEDRITLKINPESSFPTQEETEAGPIIRSRVAETTVIIKDGDTLVIGGLIDDQDTVGVNKVPLLGDIPILGIFFRSNTSRKVRNELLVFVTPRIIRE